jgi:hypothetical protein
MAESARIARRRNIMVFTNRQDRADFKSNGVGSYEIYNLVRTGAVEAGLPDPVPTESPAPGTYNLAGELLRNLNLILTYAATNNLGPTRSSRYYYMWFFSVAIAYQWVCGAKRVAGIHDAWNWDIEYSLDTDEDICIWMLGCLEVINANFAISYSAPWGELQSTYLLSDAQLATWKEKINARAQYSVWNASYGAWLASRAADGSVAAAIPPADADLPNGATRLDVAATVDPATFTSPESWTPLKIGTASQKYLTYNWNDVRSAAVQASDQTTIFNAANGHYPSESERISEIAEVVSITNGLTDAEKVSAEFWAGGPFTVSPPGMLLWMWKHYVSNKYGDCKTFIWSGLDLTLHLFETGRIVWGLKKEHMEARPIQEIRRRYRGQTVKKYDGTNILGESWVPYQETNFVTPPFADFPSGHSAFSRSFANVMTEWFGGSIDTSLTVNYYDISLISPALRVQSGAFGSFVFESGDSLIQTDVVPASNIVLSWATWADLATSAGISRKYGGIHATSAHTGSVAAANALHVAINTNFPISNLV